MLLCKKQYLNACLTAVTGALHFHHSVSRKTHVRHVPSDPQTEEGRALTYPKVTFLLWVITAIMDPCTHIWLSSPKREFMSQRIGESLWLCLSRLGQECRMHGALGLFPVTSAKTTGIPVSAGCVWEVFFYWCSPLSLTFHFPCARKISCIVSGMTVIVEKHKLEMQRAQRSVHKMVFLSSLLPLHSRAWLFLCWV